VPASFAIVWLTGCSGCHTAVVDPEAFVRLLDAPVQLVYHPHLGFPDIPDHIDIALVEGSVASDGDLALLRSVRARARLLLTYGDCAANGKLTSQPGTFVAAPRLAAEFGTLRPGNGAAETLRYRAVPVRFVVPVDSLLTGCPPDPDDIRAAIHALLARC
jgi:NAD-reducing hydrogenase small subunit